VPRISRHPASASSIVRCAVCPSCQRNSAVRRNRRVAFSQLTTLFHCNSSTGRSRYDWIHLAYIGRMIASDVGRTGSRSLRPSPAPGGTPHPRRAGRPAAPTRVISPLSSAAPERSRAPPPCLVPPRPHGREKHNTPSAKGRGAPVVPPSFRHQRRHSFASIGADRLSFESRLGGGIPVTAYVVGVVDK